MPRRKSSVTPPVVYSALVPAHQAGVGLVSMPRKSRNRQRGQPDPIGSRPCSFRGSGRSASGQGERRRRRWNRMWSVRTHAEIWCSLCGAPHQRQRRAALALARDLLGAAAAALQASSRPPTIRRDRRRCRSAQDCAPPRARCLSLADQLAASSSHRQPHGLRRIRTRRSLRLARHPRLPSTPGCLPCPVSAGRPPGSPWCGWLAGSSPDFVVQAWPPAQLLAKAPGARHCRRPRAAAVGLARAGGSSTPRMVCARPASPAV